MAKKKIRKKTQQKVISPQVNETAAAPVQAPESVRPIPAKVPASTAGRFPEADTALTHLRGDLARVLIFSAVLIALEVALWLAAPHTPLARFL